MRCSAPAIAVGGMIDTTFDCPRFVRTASVTTCDSDESLPALKSMTSSRSLPVILPAASSDAAGPMPKRRSTMIATTAVANPPTAIAPQRTVRAHVTCGVVPSAASATAGRPSTISTMRAGEHPVGQPERDDRRFREERDATNAAA